MGLFFKQLRKRESVDSGVGVSQGLNVPHYPAGLSREAKNTGSVRQRNPQALKRLRFFAGGRM